MQAIKKVVIAGGGTAGWMAAAALSKLVGQKLDITLVESEAIGTIGVGEATIPSILTINRLLQIPEPEFLRETKATFKLGIAFENWRKLGHRYIHSFGDTGTGCWAAGFHHFWRRGLDEGYSKPYGDYCLELKAAEANRFGLLSQQKVNYAYHLDATRYAAYLRKLAERAGVIRVEGMIDQVVKTETGDIQSLRLADGQNIDGDLFIDCTGFRGLLIEDALNTGYDDWSEWLPCDRAVAMQTESVADPIPYTRSIAHGSGWQWRIPLQHRVGNGLVYCSDYLSDDEATALLHRHTTGKPTTDPRLIRFQTGQRKQYWNKNCVAIGLSSGFIEPLESTSIHFIQNGLLWLLLMFPSHGIADSVRNEYNAKLRREAEHIRDFIVLHYHLTERNDTEFWNRCRTMHIPDSLKHRMELFRETGTVYKLQDDVFAENSWVQVMMGQGLIPEAYHPIVDQMSGPELSQFLAKNMEKVEQGMSQLPDHTAFIRRYAQL
jgi:tryptophan halogenase